MKSGDEVMTNPTSGNEGEGVGITLRQHFQNMMDAAANYLEPTDYVARHPVVNEIGRCLWNTVFPENHPNQSQEGAERTKHRRDQAFINDMIYMLDGPEQRAAFDATASDLAAENARLIAETATLREALASVETLAKTMRNAEKLVGPENPAERRVWVKTRYADGRALIEIIRAARAKMGDA